MEQVVGSGYGSGDGDGYGSGYGYGVGLSEAYADHPNLRNATADGSRVEIALWRSDKKGQPVNGGRKLKAAKPGSVRSSD